MRILLADNNEAVTLGIRKGMSKSGYAFDCVNSGAQAISALTARHYDLLVMDINLPKISGLEVLRRLRSQKLSLPVLILSATADLEEVVQWFDSGADNYIVKPFSLRELEARIRALLRRGTGQAAQIKLGELVFDQVQRIASFQGRMLKLAVRESCLLEALLLRSGKLVHKAKLIEHLCRWGEEVSSNAIEVYIYRLRKKLEANGIRITTMHGVGYAIENVPTLIQLATNIQPIV